MSIVITGLGAVTPIGGNVSENWQALLEKHTAISPITRFDLKGLACNVAGQVDTTKEINAVDFAITATREAIIQAGIEAARLGIITGSNFGAHDSACDGHSTLQSSIVAAIKPGGPVASISLSCSSGASAIAIAADWISGNMADAVVVVGVDAISICSWSGLCSLRTMAKCGEVRPFSVDRGGTIFAEGAGAIILESADACSARGGKPLAVLSGWATGNNGFHLTAPPPRAAGSLCVMRDAIASAGISADGIDFVTAHATATHANDLTEAQALHDLLGEKAGKVPVTAIKAASGHLLGAAGAFEAAMTVMALREGKVPALASTPTQDPEIPALGIVTDSPASIPARHALTNSAGFGGCNAALVISSIGADDHISVGRIHGADCKGHDATCKKERIAVLSSGFISALGIGSEEAEAAWAEGESACFPPTRVQPPDDLAEAEAGEVPDFDPDAVLPTAKAYLDRQCLLAMSAASLAMQGAEVTDKERFGISHGTEYGASETLDRFNQDCITKGPRLVKPMLFPHTYANAAASLISMEWELRGFHANFVGSDNASSFALCSAVTALRRNECDAVLAGGSEALSSARWAIEAKNNAASKPGEGAAFFKLVRESDSTAANPLAYIAGIGIAGNISSAITSSLADANAKATDIQRIFATSRSVANEALSTNAFSGLAPDVTIPEELTGFCGGASAAIQLACALLEPIDGNMLILTKGCNGTGTAILIAMPSHLPDKK